MPASSPDRRYRSTAASTCTNAMLKRRVVIAALAAALPAIASAQPRKKMVVGFISWGTPSMEGVYVPRLRKGLAALGYVEPRTLELVTTFVGADPALVHEAARRLVARK